MLEKFKTINIDEKQEAIFYINSSHDYLKIYLVIQENKKVKNSAVIKEVNYKEGDEESISEALKALDVGKEIKENDKVARKYINQIIKKRGK